MANTSLDEGFALLRLILIDSYRKGAITELKLDGHTSITGPNGVGKTSLLRLIPLFYGESPNKLVHGGGVNQSFVQYYLPHATSFIVFEYMRRGKVCMVALHASQSGNSVCYHFIDQPFALERFQDESGRLISGSDLNRHIKKRGEFCSAQITALSDYRAIIQNAVSSNPEYRKLAANFAFVGAGSRLTHVEKIVTGMFSRVTSFRDIKKIIVSCVADDHNIRLESDKGSMKNWVREYRAYAAVMAQAPRLQELLEAHLRHEEAVHQIRLVHADFIRLQKAIEEDIAQTKAQAEEIKKQKQVIDDQFRQRLAALGGQRGAAEARLRSLTEALRALDEQKRAYDAEDLPGLAQLVDTLPQLIQEVEAKTARKNALLGKSRDLASQYAEFRNQRVEAFHAFERTKNAEKDQIRLKGREEEERARSAAQASWHTIAAEFGQQEEQLLVDRERLAEQRGKMKHAVDNPQPDPSVVAAREQARLSLDAAEASVAQARAALDETKAAHQAALAAFQDIERQIQTWQALQNNDLVERARLMALRDAAAGTLLHFLRENRPNWSQDIGRVIQESLLLRKDLAPALVDEAASSLYGVGLDLSVLEPIKAHDESEIQRQVDELDRAIERHRQNIEDKKKALEKQSLCVRQAQQATEEQHRRSAQAEHEVKQRRVDLQAAERLLAQARQQAAAQAQQELQRVCQSMDAVGRDLEALRLQKAERQRQHDASLKARLAEIIAATQSEIEHISKAIQSEKQACDQDLKRLQEELKAALKSEGVDVESLAQLQSEIEQAQAKRDKARASEVKVSEWRRWLQYEWASRADKQAQRNAEQAAIERLLAQEAETTKERATQIDRLNQGLSSIQIKQEDLEKRLSFVRRRLERLARWAPDDIEMRGRPTRDQDTLGKEMDRLLLDIKQEEDRGRHILTHLKRAFFDAPGTTPYQFYEKTRNEVGSDGDGASPFLWLPPMQEWFVTEHDHSRRLLLNQCRIFAAGIHDFHDRLDGFRRKIGIFSKDLQANMSASTRFHRINSVAARISASFDTLDGWDKIKKLDEEYSLWAGKDGIDLPGADFVDSIEQVSDWLQGRHTLDVKLEDLIDLEIEIEEVGQPKKTVKDESELRDASSNGLSYLILCVVFVGLINKIRAGQPVQMVWPLDELRDLDLDNVRALLEMLTDNHIHLVSAFPDPDPEILSLLKNRYAIQEGRRLATFHVEMDHV